MAAALRPVTPECCICLRVSAWIFSSACVWWLRCLAATFWPEPRPGNGQSGGYHSGRRREEWRCAVQVDYLRQVKLEMVDDIMEAAGHRVHEDDEVKAAAADDPGSPPEMARRELEKIQQTLDESMHTLGEEIEEKEQRRAADEASGAS